jgi:FkbM family methyltransferase
MAREKFLSVNIGDGLLAVDAGAHHGEHTLEMAETYKRVIAVEPVAAARQVLAAKIPANVEIRAEALWKYSGVISFYHHPSSMLHSTRAVHPIKKTRGRVVRVQATALDDLDLPALDLLKVDTEGAEREVFEGASRTFGKFFPRVLIELHYPSDLAYFREYLKGLGYRVVEIGSPHMAFDARWIIGYPPQRKT